MKINCNKSSCNYKLIYKYNKKNLDLNEQDDSEEEQKEL